MITKLPSVARTVTLHGQTGVSLINNYIKGLANKLHLKSAKSGGRLIHEL
jgi:hypothetical protein